MKTEQLTAAVDAAYGALISQGFAVPYAAHIRNFTDHEGNVDREGLKAAGADAERRNVEAIHAVLVTALAAAGIEVSAQ